MKRKELELIVVLACLAFMPAAHGYDDAVETTPFQRLDQSARKSFDSGQYKRAESLWTRALSALEAESRGQEQALASTLKRLGETMLKEGKFPEALASLQRAAAVYTQLSIQDAELACDQALLSQKYKPIDVSLLGKLANDVLSHAQVSNMGILKTDSGNRVQINLPQKLTKTIDNKDVDQIGLDRLVTFDIITLPDGAVKIDNIKGLRVRAKYWVDIVASWFKPGDPGTHMADVTAQKMGIRKTVSAHLNDDAYAPVAGLVSQLSWVALDNVRPQLTDSSDSKVGPPATDSSDSKVDPPATDSSDRKVDPPAKDSSDRKVDPPAKDSSDRKVDPQMKNSTDVKVDLQTKESTDDVRGHNNAQLQPQADLPTSGSMPAAVDQLQTPASSN